MSEPTVPGEGTADATPTESLELADQQPVATAAVAAAPAPAPSRSHTRTILEVVGGVVAAGLIVVAGGVGFAVGHATGSNDDGRWSMTDSGRPFGDGPEAGGQGFGQAPGQGRGPNSGGQGYGQGPGQAPGQGYGHGPSDGQGPGMDDGMPGMQGRGVDPDGDNWSGGNRLEAPQDQGLPTTEPSPDAEG